MIRQFTLAVVALALTAASVSAQQWPPFVPRLMLRTIMTSNAVTDAQKTAISTVFEQQRPAIQAAVAAGDRIALREALQPVMQKVLATLTLEQREAIRNAVREQLESR